MGRENLLLLCSDFYRRLETTPLRPMFPEDMQEASRHLAWFLIQITGGPPLFSELRGPPMMRRRHLPFRIDAEARRIWLETFLATLGDGARYNFPEEHLPGFVRFLTEFSAWMVNTA